MDNRSTTYITVAAVTVAAGLAAYAVYFDYKRRNDVEFRKKLRKEKKRVEKSVAQSKETESKAATSTLSPESLKEVLANIKKEPLPQSQEEKEAYFMQQVSVGEQLAAQGPVFYLPAASAFFRALRIYPSPVELIVIYEKTIVRPVFELIMALTNLDVSSPSSSLEPSASIVEEETPEEPQDAKDVSPSRSPPSEASSQEWDTVQDRIGAYYDHFPPASTNVSVVSREVSPGQTRHVLVVNKDFAVGDVIYKEFPVVTALDPDLQTTGTHCGHCLRPIEPEMSLQLPKDDSSQNAFELTYCSKACMVNSKKQSHTLLFTLDSPLPAEIPAGPPLPTQNEERHAAQEKFAEYIKRENRSAPLLVARFIARQVAAETQKMVDATNPGAKKAAPTEGDYTDSESETERYALADHIERLRYLEVIPNKEELELFTNVLKTGLPGLEEFITEERHITLTGKMAYNVFGVCFGGGRNDKPAPTQRPEDVEKTRTPYGTQRQIGSALYTVSSYLTHSCQPSARPSFSSGTAEMSIVANKDLKKGDVLTIAYVDVTQHPEESVIDCRRRRRIELARGWRFACTCERCIEEANAMTSEEKQANPEEQTKDESKVEETVKKYAAGTFEGASADGSGDVE
ncbi:hypothetical protein CVT24_002145 [Panaeolus cyanescens]|uniref:SET domain-containing protein n=1 Tax=Panaeolus cyanescens TaxID=181874 RepID=A0A409YI45_9AGAR|nr:hypothetical protein CVT24_002145 [Panaeolus cyanescens]